MFRATTLLVLLGSSVQGFSPSLLKSSPRHARSTAVNVEATEAAVSTGPSLATKLGKQAQVDQLQVAHDAVHLENVALEDNDELTVSSACRVELQRALPDAMCSWPRSRTSSS